ncbi:MAG: ATP-binding protein [archaeon]
MSEPLFLKPKMGLVPEISMQNYDTIAKQLREMITNSLDANAKNVYITLALSGDTANLIVEDDGDGMDKRDLKNRFLGLGGSEKFDDPTKIGRIGIGFLASVPLCESIELKTRKKGNNKVLVASLDSKKLTMDELRKEAIENIPIGQLQEEIENADQLGYKPNFTKISLINIKSPVIKAFKDKDKLEELKNELEKILPLKYNSQSKLFNYVSKGLKDSLLEHSSEFSLNVFLNSKEPLQRRLYGDNEEENIYAIKEFKEVKVDNMKIVGYFIRKSQTENRKSQQLKKWDGLIVRVQNVAVSDNGFLGFKGYDERKKRVCGEIFIIGIDKNKAITIDRNNFNEVDPQYLTVKDYIHNQLMEFFKGVNFDWNLKSDLNKTIGIAVKLNKAMEKTSKELSRAVVPKVEKITKAHSLKESKKTKLIDLNEIQKRYEDVKIVPEAGINAKKSYKIVWDDIVKKKGEIKIDSDIYHKEIWEFQIEKELYKCQFVESDPSNKPCEMDETEKKFYINRNNEIITSLKPDYIILCILIEYCRCKTKTKDEFADKIYSLMGGLVQ